MAEIVGRTVGLPKTPHTGVQALRTAPGTMARAWGWGLRWEGWRRLCSRQPSLPQTPQWEGNPDPSTPPKREREREGLGERHPTPLPGSALHPLAPHPPPLLQPPPGDKCYP